jgi:predicted DNA-binding transcriptional regulator YafY
MHDTFFRYIEMLKMLRRDTKISASEIHGRLANMDFVTTKRTVERDLQKLSALFPIESDERNRPFGWRYANDANINLMPGLSESEALSFLLLKQFSSQFLPTSIIENLEPYFRAAQHKFSLEVSKSTIKTWPNKVRTVEPSQPLLSPTIDPAVQTKIYSALLHNKQVTITYQALGKTDASEYEKVNLLGVVKHGTVLYLVCTFRGHDDIRILALHRVQSAMMLDSNINKPEGFDLDAYIAGGAFGFGGDAVEIKLELHFYNGLGQIFLETPLSADQDSRIIDDETILISATVLDTPRLHWWLLSFGANVEVVGPPQLRDEIHRSIKKAAKQYQRKPI